MMELGYNMDIGDEQWLDPDELTHHAVIFGATGSGKTGLFLGMVEDVHSSGYPVILIDIKGDMCNIALTPFTTRVVRCLTPGANHGEPVNVFADLRRPEKASKAISQLLSMIDEDPNPFKSVAHSYLLSLLRSLESPSLVGLVRGCADPLQADLGALELDMAISATKRINLARKLNALLLSEEFEPWLHGIDLDIEDLVQRQHVTVYSVAHLPEEQQRFAITFLLNRVVRWMKEQSGSEGLRLLVGIDECMGLLPPYPANPPTKHPIMTILKQGRAFGVGMLLATQNPVDVDYKAMGQCWTWLIGRMTAERDRKRVVSGMVSSSTTHYDEEELHDLVANLERREFYLSHPDHSNTFRSRDVTFDLVGPMTPNEIMEAYEEGHIAYINPASTQLTVVENEEMYDIVEREDDDIIEAVYEDEVAQDPPRQVKTSWLAEADEYTFKEKFIGFLMLWALILGTLHWIRL